MTPQEQEAFKQGRISAFKDVKEIISLLQDGKTSAAQMLALCIKKECQRHD